MVFSKEQISTASFVTSDDWQIHEDGTVSMMFYCDGVADAICRFFGYEGFKDFIYQGYGYSWCDLYAIIDPKNRRCIRIYANLVEYSHEGRDIEIGLTGGKEQKEFFDVLYNSVSVWLQEMINDFLNSAIAEFRKEGGAA